ncbi:choice-of-anchor D domain-containing protein [Pseudorhodoplanes sp.]|uniref:choice-of-anchor D domain-containing protein n=1 Tax=Pseudorhodoplanes sp. TaxID=1934341 RepID=UPI003D12E838
MAITITANNANGDSTGIDVSAYFSDFEVNYSPIGFGYFGPEATDFSGRQYATTEQPNLIPNTTKQAVVVDAGPGGSIEYDYATHTVGGDIESISFGYGVTFESGAFPLSQLDLQVSGLGLVDQVAGGTVSALLDDARLGSVATLIGLLEANEVNFVGSTGADVFIGYSQNDTMAGGAGDDTLGGAGGNDTLTGDGGADTFIYDAQGADTITDFGAGDVIRITAVYASFAELKPHISLINGGQDTRIDFGGGNTLTLLGFNQALTEDDFEFAGDGEPPLITSNGGGDIATVNVAENSTAVTTVAATDPESTPIGFSIAGGLDALKFQINPTTGALRFVSAPNFEAPTDSNGDNSYQVIVQAQDGDGQTDTQTINVVVTNVVSEPPEIVVSGNGVTIVDGDGTPSAADHTSFGDVLVGATAERTFTVTNTGEGVLTTSKLKLAKGFTLVEGLSASIAGGSSDTFTVRMDTSKTGAKSGSITFATNDADEAAFDFAIAGNVNTGPVLSPEIEVRGNDNVIADGDTTPSATDHTDFGTVGIGETAVRTFTVNNTGDGALTISKMKLPKGFVLVEGLSPTIAAGASDTFTVRVDTAKVGAKSGTITFATNDPNENPFDFALKANVIVIPPEIGVTGNGNTILDNDTTPSAVDGTDFGTVAVGATATQTFTVNNTGDGVLTISKMKLPKGFVLVEGLSATIASGGSDTFTVRMDTAKAGVKSGTITFTTNDPDETPFNFNLTGNVGASGPLAGAPEIEVIGKGNVILDNDTTPSVTDGTDFGAVGTGETVLQTFTVNNTGDGELSIEKLKVPKGFVLTEGLSATIAAGGSDTFTLRMDTEKAGVKSGTLTFKTNDADETPFNFNLTGNVGASGPLAGAPEIEVTGNDTVILNNDTTPSVIDGTDFGVVGTGETVFQTFTVNNTGDGALTIEKLKVPKGFVLTEGLSGTIAAGDSDTFTVQIDTKKAGDKSGTLSFKTNDADEAKFNFDLTGNVSESADLLAALGTSPDDGSFVFDQSIDMNLSDPAGGAQGDIHALGHMHDFDLL